MEAGVEPEIAEQEACRIEHVISEDSFQKLANLYQRRPSNARSIEDEGEI